MNSEKVHYKMYKSGKRWLTAGATILMVGVYNQLEVQADTAELMTETQDTVSAKTDESSFDKTITLTTSRNQAQSTRTGTNETDSDTNPTGNDVAPVSDQSVSASNATVVESQAETPNIAEQADSEPQVVADGSANNESDKEGVPDSAAVLEHSETDTDSLTDEQVKTPAPATTAPVLLARTTETPEDINVWMPDKNLQYIVLYNLQHNQHLEITDVSQITKQMLADLDDNWSTDINYQNDDKAYLDASLKLESLKGLEYAKNLKRFTVTISLNALDKHGYPYNQGRSKLKDISALQGMDLTELIIQDTSVSDLTPITGMRHLEQLSVAHNFVSDISVIHDAIQTLNGEGYPVGNQQINLPPIRIHVDPKTGKYTTSAYIIDLNGNRVALTPSTQFATATGVNLNDYEIEWQNFQSPQGMLVMQFKTVGINGSTSSYPFNGNVVIHYLIDDQAGNAQVNFVDEDGNALTQALNLFDQIGQTQDLTKNSQVTAALEKLSKKGYSIKTVQGNTNWIVGDQLNTVTFVLEKIKHKVTVEAKDEDGQPIADVPVTAPTGVPGSDWTIDVPVVPGYDFVSAEQDDQVLTIENGQLTGKFGDQDVNIVLNYRKKTGKVTVHYVGMDNKPLRPSQTLEGKFGTNYTVAPETIEGWHLTAVEGDKDGQYGDDEQVVTFIYEQDLADPDPEPEPAPDPDPEPEPTPDTEPEPVPVSYTNLTLPTN